ncbi:microtubule-associated protein 2 isoform X8 [Zeugodacus cucurbitae]|uniref:microtubule-associated protein 2 isoform X8 n=1 Tax=Zeugodacus cucurbitae TaxID=28588 RepID=UPI0023D95D34|nr:microtubule-associated protein 2 isoform X8 [Zeugodacus cucurbitae]XP_054083174.1 microtubule-associated protein 2 isoform X8 [Zeugodacus cucurbitae]XP_054083175.1 microtubule-associated protein 2 isoform X8 [Zeugodacus cucurbitae]XP_054083179.1 microtubule-associated protein 2 isoform X8 [Zeugodacus cucurbitae]
MADILEKSSLPLEAAATATAVSNGTAAAEIAAAGSVINTTTESSTGIPAQPIAPTTVNDSHSPLLLKEQQHQQEQIYQQQQKEQQQSAAVAVAASATAAAAAPPLVSAAVDVKQAQPEQKEGDNDSGVDESTQEKERNGPGSPSSPAKTPTSTTSKGEKTGASRPPSATPSNKSSKSRSTSRNRLLLKTPEPEPTKKVPMNKIQVGHAPSPNLKAVRSKIGSLDNAGYKPGGGNVKIESKKIEIKAAPRIEAKNDKYTPRGGEKKIISTKLQWNAKSKIGSLENANHKPGGGDKKIETIKTDFKDKAKPKVGSKDNVKHAPGGGDIKNSQILKESTTAKDIQTQKVELKAQSKVGSLDNIKHKPGGGERKIFDDKDYLKNVEHTVALTPPTQNWKVQKVQRATTITSSMSLPAECLVLSVSMPSLNAEQKRPKSAGPKKKQGQAVHPKPFRLY